MKKILIFILAIVLSLSVFSGCGGGIEDGPPTVTPGGDVNPGGGDVNPGGGEVNPGGGDVKPGGGKPNGGGNATNYVPEGMTGEEVAKLLLAGQRLNSSEIRVEGDIFGDSSTVLRNLAAKTDEAIKSYSRSSVRLGARSPRFNGGSEVLKGFPEHAEYYHTYSSQAEYVKQQATEAANLIDVAKANVKTVDVWLEGLDAKLNVFGQRVMIRVDKNSETVLSFLPDYQQFSSFTRRKEHGRNVYEMRTMLETHQICTTYVPGESYEINIFNLIDGEIFDSTHLLATNGKGNWEVFAYHTFYPLDDPDSAEACPEFLVVDEYGSYRFEYSVREQRIVSIQVMSSDRKTDILSLNLRGSSAMVGLNFSGFDGIESVNASADYNERVLSFSNGKSFRFGDRLLGDMVNVDMIEAVKRPVYGVDELGQPVETELNTGVIWLSAVESDSLSVEDMVRGVVNECGLVCRRDLGDVIIELKSALIRGPEIAKRSVFNGRKISGQGNLKTSCEEVFSEMNGYYLECKSLTSLPTAQFSEDRNYVFDIELAPVGGTTFTGVNLEELNFSATEIALTVSDTTLFDEGKAYSVGLALANTDEADGGLSHIESNISDSVVFEGGASFTVSASNITAQLPMLAEGNYTLVAFVAVAEKEGVRVSNCIPVAVAQEDVKIHEETVGNTLVGLSVVSGEIKAEYCVKPSVALGEITVASGTTNAQLLEMVADKVFKYGFVKGGIVSLVSGETVNGEDVAEEGEYEVVYENQTLGGSAFFTVVIQPDEVEEV